MVTLRSFILGWNQFLGHRMLASTSRLQFRNDLDRVLAELCQEWSVVAEQPELLHVKRRLDEPETPAAWLTVPLREVFRLALVPAITMETLRVGARTKNKARHRVEHGGHSACSSVSPDNIRTSSCSI